MRTPTALGGFALAAAVAFGGAYGIGLAAGPVGVDTGEHGGHDAGAGAVEVSELPAGGLLVAQDGYRFEQLSADPAAGVESEFAFRIMDGTGDAVTQFTPTHDKDLHLIVASRDLTEFQHLHPTMDAGGTWRIPLTLPTGGSYRAFADFAPAGAEEALTLGRDLAVSGGHVAQELPAPARVSTVGEYEVRLDGDLVAGQTSRLTLSVFRDGAPVTDLQPYLAAYGHLVALRDGDLAYLHVHPDGEPGDGRTTPGPEITFYAEVPSDGTYRLFLDFQHQDQVRTAAFTALAGTSGPASDTATDTDDHGEPAGHGH